MTKSKPDATVFCSLRTIFASRKLDLKSTTWVRLYLIGLLFCNAWSTSQAQPPPADDVLPGVSLERLRAASSITEDPPSVHATEEAARILWGLNRLPDSYWNAIPSEPPTVLDEADPSKAALSETGEATLQRFRGRVSKVVAIRVPTNLAELLELNRLYRLTVQRTEQHAESEPVLPRPAEITVIASQIPEIWAKAGESLDEQVEVVGVQMSPEGQTNETSIVFGQRVRWVMSSDATASQWPVGWQLLGKTGFDCGLLESVGKRSRGPLVAEDAEAFYGMLAAAEQLSSTIGQPQQPTKNEEPNLDSTSSAILPQPQRIDTADLLRKNRQLIGHWLRLDMETARLSRVIVTDPVLRERLGSDAYWQIDGFGNLDNIRIELEAGQGEENLIFENRFPVSLAIVELPDWLSQKVESRGGMGRVDVSMLTEPVAVEAFFYRLWSYESEFATSRGGRQVAPLLIATQVESRAAELAASAGQVQSIGWLLAAAVIGSILLTAVVLWRVGKRDAEVRAKRRGTQA